MGDDRDRTDRGCVPQLCLRRPARGAKFAIALEAGIDVWFDQSELHGGEAWDRQIREQVRRWRLFIPVISAQSEARDEGYFRREWHWAADRMHDMVHRSLRTPG